jgi:hypothetical protein
MTGFLRRGVAAALLLATACGAPRPRPVAAPPPPPVAPDAPLTEVWTRGAGVVLAPDSAGAPVTVPYAAMRLFVLRADSARLLVRCEHCPPPAVGWVERARVVERPRTPALAANEADLAEFAVAVREAARRRDVEALRVVMDPLFVHDLDGRDGIIQAVGDWQAEGFRRLDRVPALVDRGLTPMPHTAVWASPPAYASLDGFQDLRTGFQRVNGRWRWIFLVRGSI